MNVLLLYPNLQLKNIIPTNIGILAACLKKENFNVSVFDTTLYKLNEKCEDEIRVEYGHYRSASTTQYKTSNVYEDLKQLIYKEQPKVIGVSVVDSTFPLAIDLLTSIKDYIKTNKPHIIFGGLFAMFEPDYVIENDYVDSVCIGEGEKTLVELCNKIRNNESIYNIQNLYIKNSRGSIFKNKLRPLVNINETPFEDFSMFEEKRFYRPMQGKDRKMLPLMIDRGCPYQCTFCAESSIQSLYKHNGAGNNFRIKTLDNIKEYCKHMVDTYKPEYIYFNTETFLARPKDHIKQFADFYIKEIHLPFACMTRIDTITSDQIKLLQDMGCDRLSLGLEHGNEQMRKKLKKNFTNKQIFQSFNTLKEYKIPLTLFNMIGLPEETRELAFETIMLNRTLIREYNNDITASVSIFQPFSSSILRQECIDKGYISKNTRALGLIDGSVLNMPQFSAKEIIGLTKTFIMYIYLPESLFDQIKIAEQDNEVFNQLKQILANQKK